MPSRVRADYTLVIFESIMNVQKIIEQSRYFYYTIIAFDFKFASAVIRSVYKFLPDDYFIGIFSLSCYDI